MTEPLPPSSVSPLEGEAPPAAVSLTMPATLKVGSGRSLRAGTVECDAPASCRVTAQLRNGSRVLMRQSKTVASGRAWAITLRPKPAVQRALKRARRAQIVVTATGGTTRTERRIRLTR